MAALARASFAFKAEHESQLSVAAGEVLTIIDATSTSDWWVLKRTSTGEQGYAPANHLEAEPARDAEDAEEDPKDRAGGGGSAPVALPPQAQREGHSSAVRYASWVPRVPLDPEDEPARAQHRTSLHSFLSNHEFRGATGRLQRLAATKRLARLGGAAVQGSSSGTGPSLALDGPEDDGGDGNLAMDAWGPPSPSEFLRSRAESRSSPEQAATPAIALPQPEPEPEPEPEAEPAPELGPSGTADTASSTGKRYVCKRRAVVRSGFEIGSEKSGTLERDVVIAVLEERANEQGTVRVRFNQGWISKTTAAGVVVLEEVADDASGGGATSAAGIVVPVPVPVPVPAAAAAAAAAAADGPPTALVQPQPAVAGVALGVAVENDANARWCKKCKLSFSAADGRCPGGHANFMWTKQIPT